MNVPTLDALAKRLSHLVKQPLGWMMILTLTVFLLGATTSEKIINKQDADYIFTLNRAGWEEYAQRMAYPAGWKGRLAPHDTGTSVMAFDSNTGTGLSIQPLYYIGDDSPPGILIVGSYYPLGFLPPFDDDFKNSVEQDAVSDLGPEYSVSATYSKIPPIEGIKLTLTRKYQSQWTEKEQQGAVHFVKSLEAYSNASNALREALEANDSPLDKMKAGTARGIPYLQTALDEARLVTDTTLLRLHPHLKVHFKDEYIKSLEMQLDMTGNIKERMDRHLKAAAIGFRWVNWYNEHLGELKKIPKEWIH